MKKLKSFLIIIVTIAIVIFVGKLYMDNHYTSYDTEITTSLSKFYRSNETNDLKPITELIDKNKKDISIIEDIQTKSYTIVETWISLISQKYLCDSKNVNACKVAEDELKSLKSKIDILYNYKSSDGHPIIVETAYNKINSNFENTISKYEKIINSPLSTRPNTYYEEIDQKCNQTEDCTSCTKEGICKCTYYNNNTKEELSCKKPYLAN